MSTFGVPDVPCIMEISEFQLQRNLNLLGKITVVNWISEVDHRTKWVMWSFSIAMFNRRVAVEATETEGHHFYSSSACLEPHQLCAVAKSEILQKENAENAGGYSHNLLVLPYLTLLWNLQSRVKVVAILCFWVHTIGRSFSGGS